MDYAPRTYRAVRLLLIADNHPEAGSGHVARMLALAQAAVAAGHEPVVCIPEGAARPPISWGPVPCPVVPTYTEPADVVVVDSYRNLSQLVSEYGDRPVVAYDDVGGLLAPGLAAVVNPNMGAQRFGYPRVPLALCGASYATLRPMPTLRRVRADPIRTILVGLGGTGNLDAWPRIAQAIGRVRDVDVVLYGARPHPLDWYGAWLRHCKVYGVEGYADAVALFACADLVAWMRDARRTGFMRFERRAAAVTA